ncbi:MAG TPA: hypothetical protein DEF51_32385 [Myxococcales bacterium]|nr:hypothetical protein [Myxococcales bacterium]
MARWDAAAIPQLAALFFAGVHVLLAAEIAGVVAMSYAPGERPPWLFAIGATMAAIVALFPFAVSRELLRRREWGRYWFSRWASIELVLGLSLLGLVHPSPDIPEGSEWLLILNVIVAAPAYGAKIWLRRRMAEPDVRALLRE